MRVSSEVGPTSRPPGTAFLRRGCGRSKPGRRGQRKSGVFKKSTAGDMIDACCSGSARLVLQLESGVLGKTTTINRREKKRENAKRRSKKMLGGGESRFRKLTRNGNKKDKEKRKAHLHVGGQERSALHEGLSRNGVIVLEVQESDLKDARRRDKKVGRGGMEEGWGGVTKAETERDKQADNTTLMQVVILYTSLTTRFPDSRSMPASAAAAREKDSSDSRLGKRTEDGGGNEVGKGGGSAKALQTHIKIIARNGAYREDSCSLMSAT